VDAWTFIWLMVFLKIPIVALFLLVRWAVGQSPESPPGDDGGIGPRPRPLHPHHPRSRLPRPRRSVSVLSFAGSNGCLAPAAAARLSAERRAPRPQGSVAHNRE
jgi:hypothetical protein